jgi:Ca2+-binding RTX toxin-like protein
VLARAGAPLALCAAALAVAVWLPATPSAHGRPTCFGRTATIVRGNHGNHIRGTPHDDVIVAGGGPDHVKGGHGNDVICGGSGKDTLGGASGNDILIGGKKHDVLAGSKGSDTLIGDVAVSGAGVVHGGAPDKTFGMSGHDFVVGDSYSAFGVATGSGDDILNAGPKADLVVGDSYTKTGVARGGGGRDRLHGLAGPDWLYGDNHAQAGAAFGGGRDVLNGAAGSDHLYGGPRHDLCAGGPERDSGHRCEFKLSIP